jgi:hypothetical protein
MDLDNLEVRLSTSKYILAGNNLNQMKQLDIPILYAKMGLAIYPINDQAIFHLANLCQAMAALVIIVDKQIFIGDDPSSDQGCLISYKENTVNKKAEAFFKRFEETKIIRMDFEVIDLLAEKPLFCLSGLWNNDKWDKLKICDSSNLQFLDIEEILS